MYLVFLLIWIIFNEKFNVEILLFGLVISAAVFAFICRFMDYSLQRVCTRKGDSRGEFKCVPVDFV